MLGSSSARYGELVTFRDDNPKALLEAQLIILLMSDKLLNEFYECVMCCFGLLVEFGHWH